MMVFEETGCDAIGQRQERKEMGMGMSICFVSSSMYQMKGKEKRKERGGQIKCRNHVHKKMLYENICA